MKVLITGGAGFIGSHLARSFLNKGFEVVILDNLSRPGTRYNLRWISASPGGGKLEVVRGDVRSARSVTRALNNSFKNHPQPPVIFHLAAQVAVTTSVANPRLDFELNALGTLNVLEAARRLCDESIIIFSSTNKIYGPLRRIPLRKTAHGYRFANHPHGVSEDFPLDLHSPYGCSKGAADQYVLDYHRIYGLRTLSLRQSCIYGPQQFGLEEQGWVAWFCICAALDLPITIYGDGHQCRDLLFIDDLIKVFELSLKHIDRIAGRAYNIGGGPNNALSLREALQLIEKFSGKKIKFRFSHWRPGDQKVFICDIRRARRELKWEPTVQVKQGLKNLWQWVSAHRNTIQRVLKTN